MKKTRLMFLQGCIVAQGFTNAGAMLHLTTIYIPPPPVASDICGSSIRDNAACPFSGVKTF